MCRRAHACILTFINLITNNTLLNDDVKGLYKTFRHIIKVEGVSGLYRGWGPAVLRGMHCKYCQTAYSRFDQGIYSIFLMQAFLPMEVCF